MAPTEDHAVLLLSVGVAAAGFEKIAKLAFGDKSRYVVCILDKHHSEKMWPKFEREIFTPRVASGTVIPIFLDDTIFVGIPHDLIGIKFKFDPADPNWQKRADDEIITKLIDKLSE